MPLINCPECNKEISDQAAACPHCGHPIKPVEVKDTETPTQTVKVKGGNAGLKALSFVAIVVGLIWGMAASGSSAAIGGVLFFGGFVGFIVARFMD